mmetsp:Transcript_35975/g.103415  ORF Transcript_35975/g.103415 Transcript_35975/m.103415 type:complete len:214 (-) Transcript_35975:218-859(-)
MDALEKVQRPGIGTAARSSGCAGFEPTKGASSAGTLQTRTALAMPASITSPAEPSTTARRVAGRLWGARTTPASTSLMSGLSSARSDKWRRLSISASSRGGSRWEATHQASSFMGSSTRRRACVRRFVGPDCAFPCASWGSASPPALSAAMTAPACSAGKYVSSTPSPKPRPKRQFMTSSSSRPCRTCPAMAMMRTPAFKSGCPGSSETSSTR